MSEPRSNKPWIDAIRTFARSSEGPVDSVEVIGHTEWLTFTGMSKPRSGSMPKATVHQRSTVSGRLKHRAGAAARPGCGP